MHDVSARTGNLIFWGGAAVLTATVAALVVDAHREVYGDIAIVGRMDAGVADGRAAYERHHCAACHAIFGIGARYAPDLTRVAQRAGDLAVRARLESGSPHEGNRKMPSKPLEASEIDGIAEYLAWVANADARERPPGVPRERVAAALGRAAPLPERGAALVADRGCLACHALGDRGGDRAPRLEDIAARERFVEGYRAHPSHFEPGTATSPCATVSSAERHAMGEFVASLTR